MLNLSCSTPCPIQGHIKFKRCRAYYGIGIYEDEEGYRWDVYGIYGDQFVQARMIDNNPRYSTSSESRSYSIRWLPYSYEPTISQMRENNKKIN